MEFITTCNPHIGGRLPLLLVAFEIEVHSPTGNHRQYLKLGVFACALGRWWRVCRHGGYIHMGRWCCSPWSWMDVDVHLFCPDLQIMLSCLFCGKKHQLISHIDISECFMPLASSPSPSSRHHRDIGCELHSGCGREWCSGLPWMSIHPFQTWKTGMQSHPDLGSRV